MFSLLRNAAISSFDPSRLVIQHVYRMNDSQRAVWTNSRLQSLLWSPREPPLEGGVVRRAHRHTDSDFSRNISLVLENLLKNYERSELPNHGKGKLLKWVGSFPVVAVLLLALSAVLVYTLYTKCVKNISWAIAS